MTDFCTGSPLTLHLTFIARDGVGKATVNRPKLLLPRHKKVGGVIRLTDDFEVSEGLGLAEGIETALAVTGAGWRPIWATVDAGNMAALPPLPGIAALTVFADADEAGLRAARKVTDRWFVAGRETRIIAPGQRAA